MLCFMTFFLLLLKFLVTCASSISFLCLYPVPVVFEQKNGNLLISCLSHPFSVLSADTRCLHGPVAVRTLHF